MLDSTDTTETHTHTNTCNSFSMAAIFTKILGDCVFLIIIFFSVFLPFTKISRHENHLPPNTFTVLYTHTHLYEYLLFLCLLPSLLNVHKYNTCREFKPFGGWQPSSKIPKVKQNLFTTTMILDADYEIRNRLSYRYEHWPFLLRLFANRNRNHWNTSGLNIFTKLYNSFSKNTSYKNCYFQLYKLKWRLIVGLIIILQSGQDNNSIYNSNSIRKN